MSPPNGYSLRRVFIIINVLSGFLQHLCSCVVNKQTWGHFQVKPELVSFTWGADRYLVQNYDKPYTCMSSSLNVVTLMQRFSHNFTVRIKSIIREVSQGCLNVITDVLRTLTLTLTLTITRVTNASRPENLPPCSIFWDSWGRNSFSGFTDFSIIWNIYIFLYPFGTPEAVWCSACTCGNDRRYKSEWAAHTIWYISIYCWNIAI